MADAAVRDEAPTADDRWALRLIGPLRIERAEGVVCRLTGRRERAMLAYLALAPGFRESRRNLTLLLWGDDSDSLTLDNLRTCLWSLRKSLGDDERRLVLAEREWIGLNPDLITVDVRELRAALAADAGADLERLLEGPGGELLEGLDLATGVFQDWVRDTRGQHGEAIAACLTRLIAARWADGDGPGALAATQRIMQIDPFNEVALRTMLDIYAATGRRHMALQIFQRFAERLRAELGVEPEAETVAFVKQIAAGTMETAAPASIQNASIQNASIPDAALVAEAEPASLVAEAVPVPQVLAPPQRRYRPLRLLAFGCGALAIASLGALLTIGVVFWRVPELAPTPFGAWVLSVKRGVERGPPSLAVLTFQSYGEPGAAEFADAISEGLTSALATSSEMFIVSRSSVLEFKGTALSPQEMARRLGVRYLLEGSVTRFGETVTVRTTLVDITEGGRAHAVGEYERPVLDFFTLQREITLEIVTNLQVRLTEGDQERITVAHGTRDYQAWLLAARAQKELRALAPESNAVARRYFERALVLDPNYSAAITGLGWTYLVEAYLGFSPDPAGQVRTAAELAERALKLDDQRARTHALLGAVALFAGDLDVAKQTGDRAVTLEYNDADSVALFALTLTYAGEPRRAILLLRRAMQLKPYPPRWYYWLNARAHRHAGRPEEAVRILESAGPSAGRSFQPLVELVLALAEAGQLDRARAVAEEIKRDHPEFVVDHWARMPAYKDPERRRRDLAALASAGLGE